MAIQLVERLSKLVLFYKTIILSIFILLAGTSIIILVSPRRDLISIIREDVLREIGITLVIIGMAVLFYENFLRKNMIDLIDQFVRSNFMTMIDEHCERVKSINGSITSSGLLSIYNKMGNSDILNSTHKNIKLLGITLSYYFYPDTDEWTQLSSLIENGCRLQVLMLDPDSLHVAVRERDEHNADLEGQIIHLIHMVKLFNQNLREEYRQNIEIRFYDTYPSIAMTIIDDNILRVTPYLYNKKGRSCPTIEFIRKENGSFNAYLSHFNDLWNRSKPYIL